MIAPNLVRMDGDENMAKGPSHGFFCFCKKCTGTSKNTPKPVRLGNSSKPSSPGPRPSKGQDSRKVHDTKGKNTHGRRYS